MIEIITAMIEAELAFFQVMKKLVGTKAVELLHTAFGKGPETLDAVNVIRAIGKLIMGVIDPKMLGETDIDQTVIAAPAVGVNNHVKAAFAANNGLQRSLLAIGDDLGIDPAVALENAEDDRLAARPASSFAANPSAAKIGLVDLNLSGLDRSVTSTFVHQPNTNLLKDRVNSFPRNIGQLRRFARCQIHCKIPQYLTKFLLGNSGTAIIPV